MKFYLNHLERSPIVRGIALGLGTLASVGALATAMFSDDPVLIIAAGLTTLAWTIAVVLTICLMRRPMSTPTARALSVQLFWGSILGLIFYFCLATTDGYRPFMFLWDWFLPDKDTAQQMAAILALWSPLLLGFMMLMAVIIRARRRRLGDIVLSHVAKGLTLNLPLPSLIEAAAESERGKVSKRLWELQEHLQQGEGVSDSLAASVPEIPLRSIAAIRAAERAGTLPLVLPRWIGRTLPQEGTGDNWSFYRRYSIFVVLMMVYVGAWLICTFVLPKFRDILHGFGLSLPWATVWLVTVVNSLSSLALGVAVCAVVLGCVARYIAMIFSASSVNSPLDGFLGDRIAWWTPGLRTFIRDRGIGDCCRFVADALAAGRPMAEALDEAAEAELNGVQRHRIRIWSRAMGEGESLSNAARRARMPDLVIAMLATVRNELSTAQVLDFLARHYQTRALRAREIFRAVAVPVVCCLLGVGVAMVALSVFQPMIALIEAVSSGGGHRGF